MGTMSRLTIEAKKRGLDGADEEDDDDLSLSNSHQSSITTNITSPPTSPPPPHLIVYPAHDNSPFLQKQREAQSHSNTRSTRSARKPSVQGEAPPSKRSLLLGHGRSLFFALGRFLLRNNNLVLVINLVHQLWSARRFIVKPALAMGSFLGPTSRKQRIASSQQVDRLAHEAIRAMGVMHLAFAALTGAALKQHRLAMQRSTLFVLAIASIGQAWMIIAPSWRRGLKYTLRALRQFGILDIVISAISLLALLRTVRRTGRLL